LAGSIQSAADLWQALVRSAGLDTDLYDEPFLIELASSLGIPSHDFARQLTSAGITTETLLLEVLKVMAPYGAMMKDILAFFTRAGAQASAENLRIRFDFENVTDNFEFDLSNFRDWEKVFSEIIAKVPTDEIDELQALQIRHAFLAEGVTYRISASRWSQFAPSETEVARWLNETETMPQAELPRPPRVVSAELSNLLDRVWRILRASTVRAAGGEGGEVLSADDVRMMVRGAYLLAPNEDLLLRQLRDAFKDIQTIEIETEVLVEQLLELFNLPVWTRRSEFYSVWVGAQLITASGNRVRIHSVDRTIVFSFGGAHLATVNVFPEESLHVWCELRTKGSELVGRKRAIQPDYVVLSEPISHLDSAVLVVECKQYLQQSRKKFANALIDYARNHRKAQIALVNYGPTTESVLERVAEVDQSILSRVHGMGQFRPGSDVARSTFEQLVGTVIPKAEPTATEVPESEVSQPALSVPAVEHAGSLCLSWQKEVDLDAHCWITDDQGKSQHVYFSQKLGDLGGSRVELSDDVRTGKDVEVLKWENVVGVQLDFAVHAYSHDADFQSAKPQVVVNAGGHTWILEPPEGQSGRWWKLFRLSRDASTIQIWNSISNRSPGD